VVDEASGEQWRSAPRLTGEGLASAARVVSSPGEAVPERVDGHRAVPSLDPEIAALAHLQQAATRSGGGAGPGPPVAGSLRWGGPPGGDGLGGWAAAMAVRSEGHDLPLDPPSVAAAFPAATGDLVVFVHGLGEDDASWLLPCLGSPGPYGVRLAAEHHRTPVMVRYHAGLQVSDNGRQLSDLLAWLLDVWPVPVFSVALVGHALGGQVARSAALAGEGLVWAELLSTVVTLGSPSAGASTLPMPAEPLALTVASTPAGPGPPAEEGWLGPDPDGFLRDRWAEVPFLAHVRYCWVLASGTADPRQPLGRLVGDGMIGPGPAADGGADRRFLPPGQEGARPGPTAHVRLLHHPAVYDHLVQWLVPG
jgi:hypothetical protein